MPCKYLQGILWQNEAMKENKSLFVDDSTFASNPGNVKLQPLTWFRYQYNVVLSLILAVIVFGTLSFAFSWWFLIGFVISIIINIGYWIRLQEHFAKGDSNGGIVVATNPTLVAVYTDLTKGFGDYPVIKIIKCRPNLSVGERIATVALYTYSEEPYWDDFHPLPVHNATSNQNQIQRALSSYSDDYWQKLESGISQIPKPYQLGTHKINKNNSDWKEIL